MNIGTRHEHVEIGGSRYIDAGEIAEAFVEILVANDVSTLFMMPGTDTFPIQEAIAKREVTGQRSPRVVTTLHETTAMAAAHGYFNVARRPQVVLVHVDVGTQMIGGMLHNAQRSRASIVVCAGRTPLTGWGESRGGRNREVHWIQDRQDQPGIVRDYVKWYSEVTRSESVNQSVQRAFQVAAAEPTGPVYLTLLREMLMEEASDFRLLPAHRYGPPAPPAADPEALGRVAGLLAAAKKPLLLTGYAGRTPDGMRALTSLAESLAIPVIEHRQFANLPFDHFTHMGSDPSRLLREADLVLVVDRDVPFVPSDGMCSPDVPLVYIDIDPLKNDFPLWGFPADISIQASSALALPALERQTLKLCSEEDIARVESRRLELANAHRKMVDARERAAVSESELRPISVRWLSYCIGQQVDDDTIVVADAITSGPIATEYMPSRVWGSFYRNGGSSMGWGPGAALGVKLAAPDKTVICLCADANFVNSAPESVLWTAQASDAPILIIIYNNSQFAAVKRNLLTGYPEGFSVQNDNFVGVNFASTPDFQLVARACGAHGEQVSDPMEIEGALRRAIAQVKEGRSAVVDVRIAGV